MGLLVFLFPSFFSLPSFLRQLSGEFIFGCYIQRGNTPLAFFCYMII